LGVSARKLDFAKRTSLPNPLPPCVSFNLCLSTLSHSIPAGKAIAVIEWQPEFDEGLESGMFVDPGRERERERERERDLESGMFVDPGR
jgi:hypothetical protein